MSQIKLKFLENDLLKDLLNYSNIECSMRGLLFSSKWLSDLLSSMDNTSDTIYNRLNHDYLNSTIHIQTQFPINSQLESYQFDKNYYQNINFNNLTNQLIKSEYTILKSWFDNQLFDRFNEIQNINELKENNSVIQFLKLYGIFMRGEKLAAENNFDDMGKKIDLPSQLNPYLNSLQNILEQLISAYNQETETKDPFLLYLIGMVYSRKNMKSQALESIIQSLNLFPYNWSAMQELGQLIQFPNMIDEVVKELPKSFMIQFFHIYMILEFNNVEKFEFVKYYNQLIQLFPNSTYLISQQALSFYHLRKFNQAKLVFETILLDHPNNLDFIDIYSNILYVLSDTTSLFKLGVKCSKLDKYRPETCKVLSNFYSSQSDHVKAIQYLYRALMLNQKDQSIWILLGHEYVELKNEQAALQCYKRATESNAKDYRGWYGLGQIYELLSLYQYALHAYQQACTLNPSDSRVWASLAQVYLHLNQPESAIKGFERSLECEEKISFVPFKLGTLYRNMKRTEQAVEYFEKALHPDFYRDGLYSDTELSSVHLYLGEYLFSLSRFDLPTMKTIKDHLIKVMEFGCEEVGRARALMDILARKEQEMNK